MKEKEKDRRAVQQVPRGAYCLELYQQRKPKPSTYGTWKTSSLEVKRLAFSQLKMEYYSSRAKLLHAADRCYAWLPSQQAASSQGARKAHFPTVVVLLLQVLWQQLSNTTALVDTLHFPGSIKTQCKPYMPATPVVGEGKERRTKNGPWDYLKR